MSPTTTSIFESSHRPLARDRDVRGRDDHRRPERVAMESTGSSVLIAKSPQISAAPDTISDAKSPYLSG